MKKVLLLVTILTVGAASLVLAKPGGPQGPGGKNRGDRGPEKMDPAMIVQRIANNPEKAAKLGVTEEQIEKLEDIILKQEKRKIQLKANADKARVDLRQLMKQDEPDQEAVMAAVDAVGAAQTELRKAEIGTLLKVKRILGADTVKALRKEGRKMAREKKQQFQERRGKQERRGDGEGRRGGGPGGPPWQQTDVEQAGENPEVAFDM